MCIGGLLCHVAVHNGLMPTATAGCTLLLTGLRVVKLTHTCLSGFLKGGARVRRRCSKMLTDVILEEDFNKNGESWYDPQDLEHGNNCFTPWSHPKLCDCEDRRIIITSQS